MVSTLTNKNIKINKVKQIKDRDNKQNKFKQNMIWNQIRLLLSLLLQLKNKFEQNSFKDIGHEPSSIPFIIVFFEIY